jgi:heat shock protein beta
VDSPKEYASKVYTLMKIALGYDVMPEEEQQQQQQAGGGSSGSSSGQAKATLVEAEVETIDPNDPWGKK